MDPTNLIEVYGELGAIGIISVCMVLMITNLIKSQGTQSKVLESLKINMAKIEETQENSEQILLKLIDRNQRDSEQQSDERNRRHEQLLEEVSDLSRDLAEVKGSISRLNGRH